jgi:hypothetical protein
MMETYQIDSGYFCVGIIVNNAIIQRAAPILRWAIGKNWCFEFKPYAEKKGWKITNCVNVLKTYQ